MGFTAREIVFAIRAENQASGAIRRVAKDIGGLRNLRDVQDAAAKATLASNQKIARIQQTLVAKQEAYNRALALSGKLGRQAASGKAIGGFTADEIALRAKAADSAVVRLAEDQRILQRDLDAARLAAESQAAQFSRLGQAIPLERLGRFMTLAQRVGKVMQVTGVVIAAALGAAAHSAATFETQTSLAATQARPVGAPISSTATIATKLNQQVLDQMKEFPATSQEMADSLYQIFSGTKIQSVKKASDMLHVFNQMAVAGGVDLASMTQAGISIFNNFPGEFKNMTQAANVFFAAVRYGRMTADQFASALGYIAPIAKDAGLSFRQVAEDMAFFTRQTGGKMTQQDAQGLARLIQLLARDDVTAGLKKQGIAVFDTMGKMRPIVDILTEIHDKLKLTPQETLNFFKKISAAGSGKSGTQGTIQAIRIFSQGINNAKAYQDVINHVRGDNDEMTKSFLAMEKTPGVRWKIFTNQMKALVIVIGEQAIPAFIELGKPIVKLLKWFNDLSPHTKKLIAEIGVFGSVSLIAVGTLLALAGAIGHVYIAIRLFMLFGGLKGMLGIGAEAGAATPLLAITAGLVALSVILVRYPGILHSVQNAFGGIQNILIAIAGLIGVFTVAKLTTGLEATASDAGLATGAVMKLRSSLLLLTALGVIAIPIVEHISKVFDSKHAKPGDTVSRYSGGITGLLQRGSQVLNYGVARALGSSPADAKAFAEWANKHGWALVPTKTSKYEPPAEKVREFSAIIGSGLITDKQLMRAQTAFAGQDWKTLWKLYKKAVPNVFKGAYSMNNDAREAAMKTATEAAVSQHAHLVLSQSFLSKLSNVAKLQAVYEKTHSLSDYKKYFEARNKLNTQYSSQMYQGYISDYLSRVGSANKKALNQTKKDATASATELSNAYSNIMSTYNSMLQQQQSNFGNLFSGPFMNSPLEQMRLSFNNQGPRPGDVLRDLHSQVFQYNRFNSLIGNISKRGAPNSLVNQLMAQGPSAMKDIEALNKLSPAAFHNYVRTWNRAQNLIKTNTMHQLNSQLSIYQKFGSKVALAIIAGIKSEDPKLQNELEATINRMFPDLVKKAAKAPKHIETGSKHSVAPHTTQVTHNHNFSPTINNPKTESVETSLKKAYFHMKVKKH